MNARSNSADDIVRKFWKGVIYGMTAPVEEMDKVSGYPYPFTSRKMMVTHPGTQVSVEGEMGTGGQDMCNTFWGTHGCDKKKGHKSARHVCRSDEDGTCSVIHEIIHTGTHLHVVISGKRYGVDKDGYIWELYG